MEPHHDRQATARPCGTPDVEVQAVFADGGAQRGFARTRRWLQAGRTECVGSAFRAPWRDRLRRSETIRASMADEMIYQTFLNKSDDFAEFKAARAEDREPHYRGS